MRLMTPLVLSLLVVLGCRNRDSQSSAKDYPAQIAVASFALSENAKGFFTDGIADGASGRITNQTSRVIQTCKLTRGNKVDIVQEKFPSVLEGSVDLNHITFVLIVEGVTDQTPMYKAMSATAVYFDAKDFTELLAGKKVIYTHTRQGKVRTTVNIVWELNGKHLSAVLDGTESGSGYYQVRSKMLVDFESVVRTFEDLVYGKVQIVKVESFFRKARFVYGWKPEQHVSQITCTDFVKQQK